MLDLTLVLNLLSSSDEDYREHNFTPVAVDLAQTVLRPTSASAHQDFSSEESNTSVTEKPPCSCKLNSGKPCFTSFEEHEINFVRDQYLSMTKAELDVAVLSKLSCGIHLDSFTRRSRKGQQTERKAARTDYYLHGHSICREFFKFIHNIGQDKLNALIKHYKTNGNEARVHKSTKKQPANAYKFEDRKRVVEFILNYTNIHGIELPGRTPKHWISNVKLLPTNCTKRSVFEEYKKSGEAANVPVVSDRTFFDLWQRLLPFVRTMPPASDLCHICEQGTMKLRRSANKPDREKKAVVQEIANHQEIVKKERDHYKSLCSRVKQQVQEGSTGENHVSFDFAQQVHYPYNPRQPGPIYFKTPRKCGLFGLNCEPLGKQLNILIDERHCTGKGANTVISYLHFYLENYGNGETVLYLHADNCTGQNKNNTMLWYLMWRCMNKRHESITLSFLISGHTKFSPDGGFGLIKRRYNKTEINCLGDIVDVVETSSKMNSAVLVGTENGISHVPTYNWSSSLSACFNKIKGLKSYHHFTLNGSGTVSCKRNIDSEEEMQPILRKGVTVPKDLPPEIPSPGLSLKRQWYLYKDIREFVVDKFRDTVTPKPSAPQPTADMDSEPEDNNGSDSDHDGVVPGPSRTAAKRGAKRPTQQGRGRGGKKTRTD